MSNPLLDLSKTMADAVQTAGNSTVMVNGRRRLPASGVVYMPGYVLTADHVVEQDEDIPVIFGDGTETSATTVGRDPGSDLALLKLDDELGSPISLAENTNVGEIALAVGRPSTDGLQASFGIVTAIGTGIHMHRHRAHHEHQHEEDEHEREQEGRKRRGKHQHGRGRWGKHMRMRMRKHREHVQPVTLPHIRSDATPYPGFSGGPLINAAGEMLGLNTSGLTRGASIALTTDFAWRVADSLREHGTVKRGYLGIRSQTVEIAEPQQETLEREQETGLLLLWVEANSPAAQGGLLVGDILVGVAGLQVTSAQELHAALSTTAVGTATTVELLRGGQPLTIEVTIGERA
jgi:S1-C subfamily serine protease